MKAFGIIKKGKIVFDDKTKFAHDVQKFNDDVKVVIEVREAKDVRTNQQNRLWWKWMDTIGTTIGYSSSEVHDILKYKFLMKEELIEGHLHQSLKSTTTLSKKEFKKLADDVYFWANDTLNINLPTYD